MPESYIQYPDDTANTGKKLRYYQDTVGANTVNVQRMAFGAEPTYYISSGIVLPAQNAIYLAFLNNSASGQVLKMRRLYINNAQIVAVSTSGQNTVGMIEIQVKRISAVTGGTTLTAVESDSADGALANYTAKATATGVTEGLTLYSWITNNDEIGADGTFYQAMYQQCVSSAFDGWELKELEMQPGEGFCVKQITNVTGRGSFNVMAVITKEL